MFTLFYFTLFYFTSFFFFFFCILATFDIIKAIFFLMLIFILTAIFYLYIGAEYMGFLVLIIYAGAISILFLFIVMLLDIRFLELQGRYFNFFSISFFFWMTLILNLCFVFSDFFFFNDIFDIFVYLDWDLSYFFFFFKSNIFLFGEFLYKDCFIYLFFIILYLCFTVVVLLFLVFSRFSFQTFGGVE